MTFPVDVYWPCRQHLEQGLAETAFNVFSEWMSGYMNECLAGLCSPLGWSHGESALCSAHLRLGTGAGVSRTPSGFSPSRAACDHQISARRQHQPLPSLALPRLRVRPRKALAWSQRDSRELAVGTGLLQPREAPKAQGAACVDGNTSLLLENFSQAVTHSSMVSTRISSGMSEC